MKDNRVGNEKLLVAWSNKRYRKDVYGCNICQRMKNWTEILAGKLIANKVLERP